VSAYASPARGITAASSPSIESQKLFVMFSILHNNASYGAALDQSRDSIDIVVIIVFTS
jgi:hypothetical protein